MKSSNDMRHTRMVWNSYSYSMSHLLSNLEALRKSLPFTSGRRPTSSHCLLRGNEIGRGKLATFTLSGVVHGLTLKILHKHCFHFLLINLSMSFTPQWLGAMRNSCIQSGLLTLGNDFGTTSYYFSFFGEQNGTNLWRRGSQTTVLCFSIPQFLPETKQFIFQLIFCS